jgi:hypothetical protein
MDPDAALLALREALESAQHQMDEDTDHPRFCVVDNGTVASIIEHAEALDEWLSRGGVAPADWRH